MMRCAKIRRGRRSCRRSACSAAARLFRLRRRRRRRCGTIRRAPCIFSLSKRASARGAQNIRRAPERSEPSARRRRCRLCRRRLYRRPDPARTGRGTARAAADIRRRKAKARRRDRNRRAVSRSPPVFRDRSRLPKSRPGFRPPCHDSSRLPARDRRRTDRIRA